jgi:hypothetical protein
MQSIESAGGEQVPDLLPIFAAVDVKYEFLSVEDVVFVERTAGFILVLALPEHQI